MKNEKNQRCLKCSQIIHPREHMVCLSTYNRSDGIKSLPDDHTWFHINCWADYFNSRVEKKARNQIQLLQENAQSIFNSPEIKKILSNIKGIDSVFHMLDTDLNKKEKGKVSKKRVIAKIKNGRNKAKKTKSRKTKMQ